MQAILVVNNPMPLCFRSSRSDSTFETLHYIPGTTLLGGLAGAYSRMKQGSSGFKEEFARFFTSGKIRFGNLYPANFKDKDESKSVCDALADDELSVRPVPATARSCKRFPGFLFQNEQDQDDEDKKHGVFDSLIPWGLFSLSDQKVISVFDSIERCSDCGKKTSPFSGFYRRNLKQNAVCASKAKTRMVTRTGISRQRGAVMQNILYHREILCENQKFWGILDFQDDTLWNDFESFIEDASDNEAIYLGNNKTRGMGKAGYESFRITEPLDTSEYLKQRVEKFSSLLKETAEKHHVPVRHNLYIPITLQSDLILRDHLMRYHSAVEADYLEKEWNLKGTKLIYHCSSLRRVMGWNALAGLPKADDMAIAMGSVFLFGFTGEADDKLWQILYDIETKGIGERRQEGFGSLMIAEPFHTEVNPL